ncbi:sensor histidine kinase [Clostridium thailandense]|uniref:sensor histidine kinase n=1 Tax=Clostridium thailandense TaxID=2794346 RepID=UPI001FE53CA2|nr:HAMP domain-containing sensor histidine kinase [Clostridium thailandense]
MRIKYPRFIKKILAPYIRCYYFSKDKISRSIRMELVVTFAICLLSAFIVGSWYDGYYREKHMITEIDYSNGISKIYEEYNYVKYEIENRQIVMDNKAAVDQIIKTADKINSSNSTVKVYITDLEGRVFYKSKNASEEKIDIFDEIKKAAAFKKEKDSSLVIDKDSQNVTTRVALKDVKEYVEIDGISFSDKKAYLIITGVPEGRNVYNRPSAGSFLSILQGIVAFIFLFYFITSKKMRYIEKVSEGLFQIAKGNLDNKIEIEGKDELARLAGNINFMAEELKEKIESERKAEKTKSELITNVSHDLRTPLTSIKGYLALIKDKKYRETSEIEEYINIAYNKSEKLEVLINDLFEYTKLTNKGISLNRQNIFLNELIEQLIEELYIICEENNVAIKKYIPDKKVLANVDGDKMARVFENLLMNAIRYTPKPGDIIVRLWEEESSVMTSVENRCEDIDEEELQKIFDRFYRMDKSRSQTTGGSGLGLAIAKSIVELHGGRIWVEVKNGNIVFYVKLVS